MNRSVFIGSKSKGFDPINFKDDLFVARNGKASSWSSHSWLVACKEDKSNSDWGALDHLVLCGVMD